MMKMMAGLLFVLLVGCGGGDDLDAFVKLDTAKGEAFAVGGDDCVAKAKSVREWRTKHNKDYKAAQEKLKEKYPKGPPAEMKEKYGEQMAKNKKAVLDAMFKCSSTPEFGAAIDET